MEKLEKKIDELARITAEGFAGAQEERQAIREEMATKSELKGLCEDIELMLDRHIGTFRKEFDELALRVKKLEEFVFQQQ